MCVIINKPIGRSLHQNELMDASRHNSHGAGYMYRQNGNVIIKKGFMQVPQLLDSLKKDGFLVDSVLIPDKEIALHFRIATSGGITPGRTHPFPIVKSYKRQEQLHQETVAAVMHNGIVGSMGGADYSDTQELTSTVFYHVFRDGATAAELKKAIEDAYPGISFYSSKFLFFTPGWTYWLGDFKEEDGIKYSNLNHRSTYANSARAGESYSPYAGTHNPFPSATNAVLNTLRQVWKNMGGAVADLHLLLPHVKLVHKCWESSNCITCPYFRYRKRTAMCLVWKDYKTDATQANEALAEFVKLISSTEVTHGTKAQVQERL